jgi:hypothetical protein
VVDADETRVHPLDRWWARDLLVLVVCAAVVGAAFVLTPGPQTVALAGWRVPEICVYKSVLGISCLGCGLTRSWVYLAHGDMHTASQMHTLGPLLMLTAALQVPLRGVRLVSKAIQRWRA